MSSIKMQTISHSEYLSGKYRNVSSSGGTHEAKITYKDNGSINEDETYSDNYLRSNGLGRYTKKAETSSKSSSNSKSSSSSKSGIAVAAAASSKKSSSSSLSSSSSSSSKRMERQLSDQEIDAKLTDDRLRSYIRKLVENCVDIEDEDIIERTYSFGESIGISGDEAVAKLISDFKENYDPEYIMNSYKGHGWDIQYTFEGRFTKLKMPIGNKRAFLHYLRCALIYGYIKKGENVKEWLKELDSTITLHYSNDTEVQNVYAQIKAEIEKKKQKTKKIILTTLKIIGGAILALILLQIITTM